MSKRISHFWTKEQSTEDDQFAMLRVEEYLEAPWLYWGSIENAFLRVWDNYLPEAGGHHVLEVGAGGVEMISYSDTIDAGIGCVNPITYGDSVSGPNWTMDREKLHHAAYIIMSIDTYVTKPPKKFLSNMPILVALLEILAVFCSLSDSVAPGVKKRSRKQQAADDIEG